MSDPRILCVDDEPRVLDGLQRVCHNGFTVETAGSGAEALALLDRGEVFEVIVSDMQMPQMNGTALLAEFRTRAPDTIRVLLTGQADINAAITAVNHGQIFRFLSKPCPAETLIAALEVAVAQYRLVTAEKALLEETLVGSVRALAEVLALAQPEIFGQSMRQHARVRAIAVRLGVPDPWHLEVASLLSLVGYAVLPSDVAVKLQRGASLDPAEVEMTSQVPGVVKRVISLIPRLEKVSAVLGSYQGLRARAIGHERAPLGAQILFAVSALASLEAQGGDTAHALQTFAEAGGHAAVVVEALVAVCAPGTPEIRPLAVKDIKIGMTLAAAVETQSGLQVMAQGQVVTDQSLRRVRNVHTRVGILEPILCEIPSAPA